MKNYCGMTIEYNDEGEYYVVYVDTVSSTKPKRRCLNLSGSMLCGGKAQPDLFVHSGWRFASIGLAQQAIDRYLVHHKLPPDIVNVVTNDQLETLTMNKLYQVIGKEEYGTFLVKNSAGQLVLEMKGSGTVQAFDASALEEVKPYTIGVATISASGTDPAQYVAKPGEFAEGDCIVLGSSKTPGAPFNLYRVVAIDTKADITRDIADVYIGRIAITK